MKTPAEHTAITPPVGHVYEDGLSTEELTELVSHPDVWKPAGTAQEVRDRVIRRIRNRAEKQV